jgi:hypothetical protein
MEQCDCCDPKVIYTSKSQKHYHKKLRKSIKNADMSAPGKKAKFVKPENHNVGELVLSPSMHLLKNAVVKDGHEVGDYLVGATQLIDDDIKEHIDDVLPYCTERIEEMSANKEEERSRIITHFRSATPEEQLFLKSLYKRDKGKRQHVDLNGDLNAGIPAGFTTTEHELRFLLMDMEGRCDSIKYELERRSNLPESIALKHIVDVYETKNIPGDSQNY